MSRGTRTGRALTEAQLRQQRNRNAAGEYQHKRQGEPGLPVALDDPEAYAEELYGGPGALDDLDDWGEDTAETASDDDLDSMADAFLAAHDDTDDTDPVSLDDLDDDTDLPGGEMVFGVDPDARISTMTREELQALFADVRRSAEQADRHMGTSRRSIAESDDILQETFAQMLEREANGTVVKNLRGYANRVARQVAAQAVTNVPKADRAAFKIFQARVAEAETAAGRTLTADEKDRIAHAIWESWPKQQHRRPDRNFVQIATQEITMKSLYGTDSDGEERTIYESVDHRSPEALLTDPDLSGMDFEEGSYPDLLLRAAAGEGMDRRERVRYYYPAMATLRGAPIPAPASMSVRQAGKARKIVRDYPGGVEAVIAKIKSGQTDHGTEAFFSPWGGASAAERRQIMAIFDGFPGKEADFWTSAVRTAERPRPTGADGDEG